MREAPDPVRHDRHRQGRLAGLGVERRGQPQVGQQRRVDTPGEVAQVLQRARSICVQLAEDLLGLG